MGAVTSFPRFRSRICWSGINKDTSPRGWKRSWKRSRYELRSQKEAIVPLLYCTLPAYNYEKCAIQLYCTLPACNFSSRNRLDASHGIHNQRPSLNQFERKRGYIYEEIT